MDESFTCNMIKSLFGSGNNAPETPRRDRMSVSETSLVGFLYHVSIGISITLLSFISIVLKEK